MEEINPPNKPTWMDEMVERDKAFKGKIFNSIYWIRNRQIANIIIGAIIVVLLVIILFKVIELIETYNNLIHVLIDSFKKINTDELQTL